MFDPKLIHMENKLKILSNAQSFFINIMRVSVFLVMAWIGGLKAFQYEADGIVSICS